MAIYTSFNDLNGRTLKYGDTVIFGKDIAYDVNDAYLNSVQNNNDRVFCLALKDESCSDELIHALADAAYGYPNRGGCWPQCDPYDWEALTRLVLVLYAFYEGSKEVDVEIKGEWVKINPNTVLKKRVDSSVRFSLDKYTCRMDYVKKRVTVGCSVFTFEDVEMVYNLMKKKK